MACRLIVNADDFGLTRGINRAIVELHQAGVVSSTTLMANGPAFEHAATTTAWLPTLGVGCHVVLTDGAPVLPANDIPSLLGSDRETFRPTPGSFVRDLLLGRIREEELAREAEAQIRKLQQRGIHVTHVDTHKHTHLFPRVARPLLLAAQRCGVPAIRNPFQPAWSMQGSRDQISLTRVLQVSILGRMEPSFRRLLSPGAVATTEGTLGVAATGYLDAPILNKILGAAKDHGEDGRVYELVCHPGYNDDELARVNTRLRAHRELERSALLQEIPAAARDLQLVHFGDLRRG